MITIVDDIRELIHIAGMSYAQVSSLCKVCKKYAFSPSLTIQEVTRELPAHFFYKFDTVLLISLTWRELFILSVIISDEIVEELLYNQHLADIFNSLNCAYEMKMKALAE